MKPSVTLNASLPTAIAGLSERTVKAHLGAVFEKLGVRDRLQLVLRLATMGDPNASPTKETLP